MSKKYKFDDEKHWPIGPGYSGPNDPKRPKDKLKDYKNSKEREVKK